MSSAKESRARTPSRTIRLSSARKTEIRWSGIWSIWPHPWEDGKGVSILGAVKPPPPGPTGPHHYRPPARIRAVTPARIIDVPGRAGYRESEIRPVRGHRMRIESSFTSITWIPSEAIKGMTKMPFEIGVTHYDAPPPDTIDDLEALRQADRFRFANDLRAWIDVEEGRIVDSGYTGRGHIGSTTVSLGLGKASIAAVSLPDRQLPPETGDTSARFVQTAGGRTGLPLPRRVKYPPFIQVSAPLAWTTLALTIHSDGRVENEVIGASPFPRHWMYDGDGKLAKKTGLIDYKSWSAKAFGAHSPWGDEDSPALVTEVESALERELP